MSLLKKKKKKKKQHYPLVFFAIKLRKSKVVFESFLAKSRLWEFCITSDLISSTKHRETMYTLKKKTVLKVHI